MVGEELGDPALADGVRSLVASPALYDRAVRSAAAKSGDLSWESGAVRYAEFVRSLAPGALTASN
jgi:hypothetical protein